MITKRNLTDQLVLLLGRTTSDSRIDPREVSLNVGQVRDELLAAEYLTMQNNARALGEDAPGIPAEWLTTFTDVPVAHDTTRNRDYVQLPFEPLAVGPGLFSIAPMADEFNAYAPTKPGNLGLLRNHPAFALGGRVGYWREQGDEAQPSKAWFASAIAADSPTVLVKMVCPSAGVKDDAPFFIPTYLQPRLLDLVRQRYATKPAPEQTNDGRDQV